jgi:hypothetical protein
MTQQEIQERNEQIALMVGGIYSKYANAWGFGNARIDYGEKIILGKKYKNVVSAERWEKELLFHSDWNWLMDAVEFIESLGYNIEICSYHGNDTLHYCSVHKTLDKDINDIESIIKPIESDNKKEAVFIAVSYFAKLYNEKKL